MNHDTVRRPAGWLRTALALGLLGGCLWFIWSNSLISPAESQRRSEAAARFVTGLLGGVLGDSHAWVLFLKGNIRKIAHAAEFFVLGVTLAGTLMLLGRVHVHLVLHAMFAVLAVAVTDEALQIFSGRGAQVQDVLLDFAGGMAGLWGALLAYRVVRATLGRKR